MNEDKEMVPVSQLREAEARAEKAEADAERLAGACKYVQLILDSGAENLNEIGREMLNRVSDALAAHDAGKE